LSFILDLLEVCSANFDPDGGVSFGGHGRVQVMSASFDLDGYREVELFGAVGGWRILPHSRGKLRRRTSLYDARVPDAARRV
jgi:hypothetical protein